MSAARQQQVENSASRRDKIIERVRALLAMSTSNGCSEAEAVTAAEMAARYMREYDLSIDDVQAIREEVAVPSWSRYTKGKSKTLHAAAKHCAGAVGQFFDCKLVYGGEKVVFFGLRQDTELAHAMLGMLRTAMDQEVARFRKTGGTNDGVSLHVQSTSFLLGMGIRISERLRHLKAERTTASEKGTNLVVLKTELVTEAYASFIGDIRTTKARFQTDPGSAAAYGVGYVTGDRVALNGGELTKPAFDPRTLRERAAALDALIAQRREAHQRHEAERAKQAEQGLAGGATALNPTPQKRRTWLEALSSFFTPVEVPRKLHYPPRAVTKAMFWGSTAIAVCVIWATFRFLFAPELKGLEPAGVIAMLYLNFALHGWGYEAERVRPPQRETTAPPWLRVLGSLAVSASVATPFGALVYILCELSLKSATPWWFVLGVAIPAATLFAGHRATTWIDRCVWTQREAREPARQNPVHPSR